MIDVINFKQSIIDLRLPADLPLYSQALWYDGTIAQIYHLEDLMPA